jgi:hypothetical protein
MLIGLMQLVRKLPKASLSMRTCLMHRILKAMKKWVARETSPLGVGFKSHPRIAISGII